MPNLQKARCFPFLVILLFSRIIPLLLLNHSALNGMVMSFFYTSRLFINFHCLYVDIKFVLLLYFRYHGQYNTIFKLLSFWCYNFCFIWQHKYIFFYYSVKTLQFCISYIHYNTAAFLSRRSEKQFPVLKLIVIDYIISNI